MDQSDSALQKSGSGGVVLARVELQGSPSFRYLKVDLEPGGVIVTEPGAMASCDADVDLESDINGGIITGLIAKYLGGESFFISIFKNRRAESHRLYLTQRTPGEIVEKTLNGEEFFMQPGAFIAQTPAIKRSVKWAGIASWIAGEGLFRLSFTGRGRVWYGSYGAIVEKDLNGEMIVDSGHLLSYPPTVQLSVQLAGGLFSSFFGGEGFVLKLTGHGKIQLQTRSVSGLASWLNPRFWG